MTRRGLVPTILEGKRSLVDRPGFKPGGWRHALPGGFDSHSLPPLGTVVRAIHRRNCRPCGRDRAARRYTLHRMFAPLAHRLTTTLLVVVSLLFSQLALANYVCPGQADAAAMAEMMASGAPVHRHGRCAAGCCATSTAAGAAQSFEAVKLPTVSLPAIVQVIEVPWVVEGTEAVALPVSASLEARPPPDPVYLSTLRLRV